MFDVFQNILDNLKKVSEKVDIKEYKEGSYLAYVADLRRFVVEAQAAMKAAKESFAKIKKSQTYNSSAQIQANAKLVDKAIDSANNIVNYAVTNINKLGG